MVNTSEIGKRLRIEISIPNPIHDLYLATMEFAYWVSEDYGATWHQEDGPIYSSIMTPRSDLVSAPSDHQVLYRRIRDPGLYLRSEDGGETWRLPRYEIGNMSVEEFVKRSGGDSRYYLSADLGAVDPKSPLTVYATFAIVPWGVLWGSIALRPQDVRGYYVSHDGGNSWSKFSSQINGPCPLGIDPNDPGLMLGCSANGLIKSVNHGQDWQAVSVPQELRQTVPVGEPAVKQIVFDPGNASTIYLVARSGLYGSKDAGATWCHLNLGISRLDAISNMAIAVTNSAGLVVGTDEGAFFSSDAGSHFHRIYPPVRAVP